jgi:hypothetical protein
VPFDVAVFPVQRTQRRRAHAAWRVAHVGVRAVGKDCGERGFISARS